MPSQVEPSSAPTTSNADLLRNHTGNRPDPTVHKTEPPEPAQGSPGNRTNYDKIFGTDVAKRLQHEDGPAAHADEDGAWPVHKPTPTSDGMSDVVSDVRTFMQASGQAAPSVLTRPHSDIVALRRTLIDEEVNKELLPALDAGDLLGIADGCADAIVVIVGTAIAYGIPLPVIWAIVDRANMAKVDPVTGKVTRRDDGKILKPAGWEDPTPHIAAALGLTP